MSPSSSVDIEASSITLSAVPSKIDAVDDKSAIDAETIAVRQEIVAALGSIIVTHQLSVGADWIKQPSEAILVISSALSDARRAKESLDIQIAQLRAQTSELADIKLSFESLMQQRAAREACIKDLEAKVEELTAVARRESDHSDNGPDSSIASPVSRMSFSRAATPTAKYPPITPPPSMPPPPVPSELPPLPFRPGAAIAGFNQSFTFPSKSGRPGDTPSTAHASSPASEGISAFSHAEDSDEQRLHLEADVTDLRKKLSKTEEDLHAVSLESLQPVR